MDQSSQRVAKSGPHAQTPMPCGLPDNFPARVAIVDGDGRIAYASNKFAGLLGKGRLDIIGQNLARFLSNVSQDDVTIDILGDQPISDVSAVLHQQNGSELTVLLSADRWIDPDGKRYRVIEVADVTGLRQANERSRLKSFRLQSCLEGTNAGTWEWNVQTGETKFNDRWAEIVGYRLDELEPVSIDTWTTLAHPDDTRPSGRSQNIWRETGTSLFGARRVL